MTELLSVMADLQIGWSGIASVLKGAADFLVFWLACYYVVRLIRGTRAQPMAFALLIIAVVFWASGLLGLRTTHWALEQIIGSIIIVVVVLFQAEIRRGLFDLGLRGFSGTGTRADSAVIEELVRACQMMSDEKIGALIAIDRGNGLNRFTEEGIEIDARISRQLLYALFNPAMRNPTHDGAVILQDNRIRAAGCFVPLTSNPRVDKALGTRHRAGIGLTEDTNALVLIVSEETGIISIAEQGNLTRKFDQNTLREELQRLIGRPERDRNADGTERTSRRGAAS